MKALTYVEIDVDYCSLRYSFSPCVAALGVTGDHQCFNTLSTCQDRAHFVNAPVTLRFAMPADYLPDEIYAIPSIDSVSLTPGVISLGGDLGQRASLKVTLRDHPHSDTGPGFDKYVTERPYDPFRQGSFWAKFRARQPYLRGRPIRVIQGLLGQSLAEMETRHYTLESFDGPTTDGKYTLTAKDVLKLADGDRSQAPRLSNGYISSEIDEFETTASLFPVGIGNAEYPSSGYAAIGGTEIVSFTRSGNTLTIVRGVMGTDPVAHDAQDRVQICIYYEGMDPADVISDLLINYADVPSAYVPLSAWLTETQTYQRRIFTAMLAEPTSVATLVSELIEQAALAVWWDALTRLINLRVLREISPSATLLNDSVILEKTLQTSDQPDTRVSQVWTYFGLINPLESQTESKNYRSAALTVDLEAQTDYGSAAIKKIYSRWIPAFGRIGATRVNDIQIGRFRTPPRRFQFSVMRYTTDVQLGASYLLDAWNMQLDTGARETVPIQVTRVNPKSEKLDIEAEELRFVNLDTGDTGSRIIMIESDTRNINIRSIYNTLYPPPVSGDLVQVFVEGSARVYSTRVDLPALTVGDWPAGVTVQITLRGRVTGKGGNGGKGWVNPSPTAGEPGGTAIYARHPFFLIQDGGAVWGGGGGGGGGNVNTFNNQDDAGGGGGGGAGYRSGNGGVAAAPAQNGAPGTETTAGTGGLSYTTRNWWDQNYLVPSIHGGDGGGLGQAGANGIGHGGSSGAAGGTAGIAIDGRSYATITGAGDRRGPEVN